MGKGACFIKAVLHMVNRFKQRKVMCSHFRLISSNEMQTVFRLSPSLFSQPCRFRRAVKSASFPPGEAKGDGTNSPKIPQNHNHLPRNPSVSPYGLPAPLSGALLVCISNLPFQGRLEGAGRKKDRRTRRRGCGGEGEWRKSDYSRVAKCLMVRHIWET